MTDGMGFSTYLAAAAQTAGYSLLPGLEEKT